ncbi:hypothetical protein F4859DRAFT_278517 [Xylaria cf. heliscus]|nr:hypothetical protein F4859DRAFT_278517 [Xylaria cf. heliscus]
MPPFIGNLLQVASRQSSSSSRCSHAKIPPTMENLDAQGDMMLLVGKQKCTDVACHDERQKRQPNAICFHVNSAVVAGASPAFGLALYSPSAEATKEEGVKWTVKLPDDDPEAMRIIIHILYGYYPITPPDERRSIDQLLNLTVLANKYDLVHLFPKWVTYWVEDMELYWVGKHFVGQSTEDLESLLWIFWVLGHEPLYTYMVLQLAFYSELDAAGRLTDPAEQLCFTNEFRDVPVPPCATIEVGHVRIEVLKMIRKDIKETLGGHLNLNLNGNQKGNWLRCRRMDGKDDRGWRESVSRSFVEMLVNQRIWPFPSAYRLTASPRGLLELFRANPNIPSFVHHHHHGARFCDADGTFWERIEWLLREVSFTLPVASANHLREQAIKSGLASYFESKGTGLNPNKGHWSLTEILEFQAAIVEDEFIPV